MLISETYLRQHIFRILSILPFLIFIARILDVTIGTIRIVMVSKGQKFWAPTTRFF
jgi:uncharacterized protein YebE (UPF0316 family)